MKIRARDEYERQRIVAIAIELVLGQIEKGEFDPHDDEALRQATRLAVKDAAVAYRAAMEYLCG
jgi:predicted exporter